MVNLSLYFDKPDIECLGKVAFKSGKYKKFGFDNKLYNIKS